MVRFPVLLASMVLCGFRAVAETHALLIGVSDYYHLDADLRGPANDVVLMAEALAARGAAPENLRVLAAEGVTTAKGTVVGRPERAVILREVQSAVERVKAGDDFVLYFSGHGSQAPDQNGDEAGGFDEILLPADTRKWSGAKRAVPGAIVDDEWRGFLQPILDKGVRVIGVIDACHSSTGFRALGHGVARYVAPEALGLSDVPDEGGASGPGLTGDYVFLYSAQSDERAFEYPLGDPANPANWHGDFTANLTGALMRGRATTWREVLTATKNAMRLDGPAPQTPAGEGPALDDGVLGVASVTSRYVVENGVLQAGLLQGVQEGWVVAVGDVKATVAAVEPLTATLTADGPLPQFGFATVEARPAALGITVSTGSLSDAGRALVADVLVDGVAFTDGAGDFELVERGEGIAVARAGGRAVSQAVQDVDGLAEALGRAVHLERVRFIMAELSRRTEAGFTLPGTDLEVSAKVGTAQGTCEDVTDPVSVAEPLRTAHCDQLWFSVHNPSQTARDVTVLYVDQDMGISPIWPVDQQSNRILFGETRDIGLQLVNTQKAPVLEEVLVIAVPAEDGQLEADLTYLADPDPGASRSVHQTEATRWVDGWITPGASQRGFGLPPPNIMVFRFNVQIDGRN